MIKRYSYKLKKLSPQILNITSDVPGAPMPFVAVVSGELERVAMTLAVTEAVAGGEDNLGMTLCWVFDDNLEWKLRLGHVERVTADTLYKGQNREHSNIHHRVESKFIIIFIICPSK